MLFSRYNFLAKFPANLAISNNFSAFNGLPLQNWPSLHSPAHSLLSRANVRHGRQSSAKQPRLLIFDKDGTLICFDSLWVPWIRNFAEKVDQASHLGISSKVFGALGFCPVQKKVRRGLLAEGTMGQIRERIAQLLVQHGMEGGEAREIVERAAHQSAIAAHNSPQIGVRQLCNLEALFRRFRRRGIKIAICTADSRASTLGTLEALGLGDLVDLVVCGDDNGSKPKPDPGNALFICRQLGIDPADTMVVGDTPADLGMGRKARLGMTVGVLSGVGAKRELEAEADHLVEDVGELVRLIG